MKQKDAGAGAARQEEQGKEIVMQYVRKYVKEYLAKGFGVLILGVLLFSGLWGVEAKADGSCKGYLTPYWTRNASDGDNAGSFLMLGKEYTNGEFKNKYADDMVVLYNLDKNYSNVTFLAGALDGYSKYPADYKIYLDGELVRSFTREVNAAPMECSISTVGKTQLMVRIDAKTFSRWGIVNVTATGHQWELESQLAATVDSTGSKNYVCLNCKAKKTESVSALTSCPNYLTPYESYRVELYQIGGEESFRMMGHDFTQGFYANWLNADGSASYNLEGLYSSVIFTVGVLPKSGYNTIQCVENPTATLKIYLDNQLYKSMELSIPMMNQEITVPTTGKSLLRIEIEKESYTYYGVGNIRGIGGPGHTFEEGTVLMEPAVGKTGIRQDVCTKCAATKNVTLPALKGTLKADDVTVKGTVYYTGKPLTPSVAVSYDGMALKKGTDYTVSYQNNVNVGTAKVSVTGIGNYEGTVTKTFKIALKNGMTFKKGKYTYKITSASSKTVTLTKGDASLTSISVPATVSYGGVSLKVTAIGSRAFYKGKATKAVVGSNVTSVGTSAFESCTKLKSVKIGSKVSTIGNKAFYKCTALTTVTIPTSVTKIGTSAFQSCTKLASVTIGKNVKTIGSKAFYGDKNLKTIAIKTTKLTAKTVGSSAFKNIYAKAKVTVPASKSAEYKTLLRSKGLGSKAILLPL
ncbi:MAG: leucine-rich repeat domain-containing protein [Candidatus Limivivens sp.]|nr:leucine-rich repeat domain-containing protein [Candidatus Limivivens sp.]